MSSPATSRIRALQSSSVTEMKSPAMNLVRLACSGLETISDQCSFISRALSSISTAAQKWMTEYLGVWSNSAMPRSKKSKALRVSESKMSC
ncbi:hypothetical protein D9M69_652340 [compost metagenome]